MKFIIVIIRLTAVLLTAALFVVNAGAQDLTSGKTKLPETTRMEGGYSLKEDMIKNPLAPPDTSSPRATLKSFMDDMNRAYRVLMAAHRTNMKEPGLFTSESIRQMGRKAEQLFERGVYCLDLSEVPDALKKSMGYEGAIKLKEIFDRIELPVFEEIPDARAIEEQEQEKVADLLRWRLPNTAIIIAMVKDGPRRGEYLFAPETVARLDEFLSKVQHLPYKTDALVSAGFIEFYDTSPGVLLPPKWSRWLPAWSTATYLYQTIWQWCALFVLPLVALFAIWALYRGWGRSGVVLSPWKRSWGWVFITLISTMVVILVSHVLVEQVHITGAVLIVCEATLRAVFWFLLAAVVFLAGTAAGETIVASPKIDPEGIHASLIRGLGGLIGFAVAAIVIFHGLSSLGVSLIPMLTGLGVGGLAFALAARPTLENLIGSFMILLDRPYRIGQRVKVKGYEGDVEKIGLRSTRIRLLTGHQTVIPNEEMARLDIENIGRRPYIRRKTNITITYDTPPEKIEEAVKIIADILENHEGMALEFPPRVFFNEFNADSLNIVMYYWYNQPDLWDFYTFSQKVNLQIMREFEKEGIEFAFPTTTNYLTQEDGQPLHINIAGDLQPGG